MKAKAAKKESVKLIESFEELCIKKEINLNEILPDVSKFPEKHREAVLAMAKMYLVAEDLNEGWQPDWDNGDEYKYFPWFDMEVDENNPSGFRFHVSGFGWTISNSTGGSRLCYKTRGLAEYAGKTFVELYRAMMVIPK